MEKRFYTWRMRGSTHCLCIITESYFAQIQQASEPPPWYADFEFVPFTSRSGFAALHKILPFELRNGEPVRVPMEYLSAFEKSALGLHMEIMAIYRRRKLPAIPYFLLEDALVRAEIDVAVARHETLR